MRKSIAILVVSLAFIGAAGCGPGTDPVEPGEFADPPGKGEATEGAKKGNQVKDKTAAVESMD